MTLYFQIIESSEHHALCPCLLLPLSCPLSLPAFRVSRALSLIFWKFYSIKFLLYLLVFLKKKKKKALEWFLYPLYHCIVPYHLGFGRVWMEKPKQRCRKLQLTGFPAACVHRKYWKVWCLERVPFSLVYKVMTCLCQKFLYISFISWEKVYFYVFRSMNGTL